MEIDCHKFNTFIKLLNTLTKLNIKHHMKGVISYENPCIEVLDKYEVSEFVDIKMTYTIEDEEER